LHQSKLVLEKKIKIEAERENIGRRLHLLRLLLIYLCRGSFFSP